MYMYSPLSTSIFEANFRQSPAIRRAQHMRGAVQVSLLCSPVVVCERELLEGDLPCLVLEQLLDSDQTLVVLVNYAKLAPPKSHQHVHVRLVETRCSGCSGGGSSTEYK